MKRANLVSGLLFAALSMWLLFYAIPYQTEGGIGYGLSPSGLPYTMAGAILVLSIALVISNLKKKDEETEEADQENTKWRDHGIFWIQIGTLFTGLLIGMHVLGFVLTGIIFMAVLQFFLGQRNFLLLTVLAVALPLFLYMGFRHGMGILLPTGIVF